MMGIPGQSVLFNTTIPESTIKKKSQSLGYYFVREGVERIENGLCQKKRKSGRCVHETIVSTQESDTGEKNITPCI